MTQPEITWTIPLDRANTILSIVAQRPFAEVAEIIGDLQRQAQPQIQQFQREHPQQVFQPPGPRPNGSTELAS
jgi:hypothetical protein